MKIAAFLAIYLIWGSTFLATRYAVATIPPFFVSGTRFFLAGLILFAYAQFRNPTRLNCKNWVAATSMGALFFLVCHGGVSWADVFHLALDRAAGTCHAVIHAPEPADARGAIRAIRGHGNAGDPA